MSVEEDVAGVRTAFSSLKVEDQTTKNLAILLANVIRRNFGIPPVALRISKPTWLARLRRLLGCKRPTPVQDGTVMRVADRILAALDQRARDATPAEKPKDSPA